MSPRARRVRWLRCNLAAFILAAFLSGVYQKQLETVTAPAFFIPVASNLAEIDDGCANNLW